MVLWPYHKFELGFHMKKVSVRDAIARYGTQQKLADDLGISRQTVKRWVSNNSVTRNYLAQFCRLTGCKPEEVSQFAADVVRMIRANR